MGAAIGVAEYGTDTYGGDPGPYTPPPEGTGPVFPDLLFEEAFTTDPLAARPRFTNLGSDDLRSFTIIQNGRSSALDSPSAGSGTFVVDISRTRNLDPINTASAYWPNVVPGRRIRFRIRADNVVWPMFGGFANAHNVRYEMPDDAFVDIPAGDAFKILRRSSLAGMAPRPREKAHIRVRAILAYIGWPTSLRRTAMSSRTYLEAEDISDRAALDALLQIDDTEVGRLTVAPDGVLVFMSRPDIQTATRQTVSQATFSDSGVAGTIPYQSIVVENSDTQIRNIARITSPFADELVLVDQASYDKYGPADFQREVRDIAEAARRATGEHFLAEYAEPLTRILGVNVLVSDTPPGFPTGLFGRMSSLRVGDRVTVERTKIPGGGPTFSQDCFIEAKTDAASQQEKTWTCDLGFSYAPAPVVGSKWGTDKWDSAKWVF